MGTMLKPLRPVSDLQRVLRFDDYDLTANRGGLLSTRQRWKFIGARLVEHFLAALTITFIAAWIANTLGYQPELDIIAITLALIVTLTALLFAIRIRPAFAKAV